MVAVLGALVPLLVPVVAAAVSGWSARRRRSIKPDPTDEELVDGWLAAMTGDT